MGLIMSKKKSGNAKQHSRIINDGLRNVLTGLGTDRDRRTYNQFTFNQFSFSEAAELEAAYCENWIARAIVDYPVDDATREWRVFNAKEASKIVEAENFFNLQSVTQEAFKWSGLYGGAGVLLITDQDLSSPLNLDKIKKGSLKRLLVLDRMFISGQDFNTTDPLRENYGLPEFYIVNGGKQRIHHSHFVRASGAILPRRLKLMNGGWDDSRLRRCMEDVKDAVSAKGGIAALIQEANIDIITRDNLANDLSSDDMDSPITERFRVFAMMKSLYRLALLDSSEQFDRKQISFGGLGEILSILMEWTAGAAVIPMTRLFGVQSKGLGDSGKGDMNNYNNTIRSNQKSQIRPFLNGIDEVLVRSALGYMPEGLDFEFNPLSQPSNEEISTQQLADAQTDEIRLQQRVVTRSQVAKKLQEQGIYAIDNSDIEAMEQDEKAERGGDDLFRFGESNEYGKRNQIEASAAV